MFGVPEEGLPVVYRVGGSQVYHLHLDCARLQRAPSKGRKVKRPSPFDVEQAKALGWTQCASCSKMA